jgi:hypothetical protein
MNKISISIIALLALSTMWFGQKNSVLEKRIGLVSDTLNQIKVQQFRNKHIGYVSPKLDSLLQESVLDISDTIKEIHRITCHYGWRHFLIRLELKHDSSVNLTCKRYEYKHPLTNQGIDSLYSVKFQKIDKAKLCNFIEKLSKIEFLGVTIEREIMCCFGGGGIQLESVYASGQRNFYGTFCRTSEQFAEACEYMMRQVDNDELRGILKAQDDAMNR